MSEQVLTITNNMNSLHRIYGIGAGYKNMERTFHSSLHISFFIAL